MTNPPDNLSSSFHTSSPEADEKPINFEPGHLPLPEVGQEGRLRSVENAMVDINHIRWAMNNLGDELLPGATSFDKQAAESLAAVIIHSMRSLEASLEAVFIDLDTTRTNHSTKE